ncbi:MAG: winged helix-turn-helix transcriptional regulator [Brucella sp.]|uniref:winged helix-turn-helix transcriptional regulator n=1 Tax=Brucella tritici TaxID=94626 RepID=UPI001A19AFF5|nr:winged helix-turn-helix transcriptional regulator [Brucella tritici]MBJ6722813.1 helix-turn-helix transcriptional regulator [Bacillus sp. PR5]
MFNVVPPKVEYSLTALGETFVEPFRTLYSWAQENASALDRLEDNQRKSGVSPEV